MISESAVRHLNEKSLDTTVFAFHKFREAISDTAGLLKMPLSMLRSITTIWRKLKPLSKARIDTDSLDFPGIGALI